MSRVKKNNDNSNNLFANGQASYTEHKLEVLFICMPSKRSEKFFPHFISGEKLSTLLLIVLK